MRSESATFPIFSLGSSFLSRVLFTGAFSVSSCGGITPSISSIIRWISGGRIGSVFFIFFSSIVSPCLSPSVILISVSSSNASVGSSSSTISSDSSANNSSDASSASSKVNSSSVSSLSSTGSSTASSSATTSPSSGLRSSSSRSSISSPSSISNRSSNSGSSETLSGSPSQSCRISSRLS